MSCVMMATCHVNIMPRELCSRHVITPVMAIKSAVIETSRRVGKHADTEANQHWDRVNTVSRLANRDRCHIYWLGKANHNRCHIYWFGNRMIGVIVSSLERRIIVSAVLLV